MGRHRTLRAHLLSEQVVILTRFHYNDHWNHIVAEGV
jgi:hypothetical protein